MMNPHKVLAFFREVYQNTDSDEALIPLCIIACKDIEKRVKNDVDFEDIRLYNLASAMVQNYLCRRGVFTSDGVVSFKAGDVTVKGDISSLKTAAKLDLEDAIKDSAPLLKDSRFTFRQVRV